LVPPTVSPGFEEEDAKRRAEVGNDTGVIRWRDDLRLALARGTQREVLR
jgi:hypothetical protein